MKGINRWMSKKKITHLLLDGGTISASEGFLEAYISDVLHDERLCVVEQKTGMFRFFVDIDFVSDENQLDFVAVTCELFRIVDMGKCVLARARPREIQGKGTKYGVHVIWPESKVSKKSACSLRQKILDEMGSDWEGIFDPSVYSGSGLRMLWSYKGSDDNSTPYIPWGIVAHTGFTEFQDKQPSVDFLNMFSIRIENSIDDNSVSDVKEDCSELETFIRKNFKGQENARILKINKCKNKKDFWLSTDSKYCENVNRLHKCNHVWFCLNTLGIMSQRCLDEECKGFVGKKYKIPSRLIPNERSLDCNTPRRIIDYFPDGLLIDKNRHVRIGTMVNSGTKIMGKV